MSAFKLNTSKQLLAVAMGFVFSASAVAAVTSAPTATVKGRVPVMTTPEMNYVDADSNGILNVGDTLSAVEGTFSDLDGDTAIAPRIVWRRDGTEVGSAVTYALTAADKGATITLEMHPRTDTSITDPAEGLAVVSSGGTADPDGDGDIDVPGDGTVLAVTVTGYVDNAPQVGSALTATPVCEGGACTNETYQWQIETAESSGVYIDIASATQPTYTPVKDDQKRMIRVVVDNI